MMQRTPKNLADYYSSKEYHVNYVAACLPNQIAESYGSIRGKGNGSGASSMAHPVTTSELQQRKNNNERFHEDPKEDKYPT
jgi:hypothetical protein